MATLAQEVRNFCSHNNLKLNTDLGQHFLTDETVLQNIIAAADVGADEQILEIGPGIGILTRELLRRTPHVTAIELDGRMLPLLHAFVGTADPSLPKPDVIIDNALNVPFPRVTYKIVANIPYHITSPLLRHAFLEGAQAPVSLTLLIQREVAEKICDKDDRSLLSIIVALFGTPHIVCNVPAASFLPPPKVESSVLHIACFDAPKTDRETVEKVIRLAKIGFSQKRKMLRNTLALLPGGEDWLRQAGIDLTRRPQTLSVDEWISLARASA